MQVRHLSYFVALAQERHFARAAEICNIAQPTLSAAIRRLEEDLNVRLVVRGHSFTGLTAEGEKLLSWGRQILADYHSLRDDLTALKQGLTGTLRLGVIPVASPTATLLTTRFCAAYPAATVDVRILPSFAIQDALDRFEIDGGMTYLDNEQLQNVRRFPLYRERYIVLAHRDHPIARRQAVTWAEIAGERLCLLSRELQNRRIIDNLAASLGLTIKPQVVSNSLVGVCSHVLQGDWISILPHTVLSMFCGDSALVAIDLVDPVHSQAIGLVLSDRDPPSPMASALMGAILDADLQAELDANAEQRTSN